MKGRASPLVQVWQSSKTTLLASGSPAFRVSSWIWSETPRTVTGAPSSFGHHPGLWIVFSSGETSSRWRKEPLGKLKTMTKSQKQRDFTATKQTEGVVNLPTCVSWKGVVLHQSGLPSGILSLCSYQGVSRQRKLCCLPVSCLLF